ncbi:MAG: sigma 54-interacting transcriptional regulator [Myxococcales bacterium]|nr:sigma 54-interacting transcriptional regulator [Myxococcales bacterium]
MMGVRRPLTVVGFYAPDSDSGGTRRWERWRPTLSLMQHPDRIVDRLELLIAPDQQADAADLLIDIASISPETTVVVTPMHLARPWDFDAVYSALYDFSQSLHGDFELLVHVTTAPQLAQVALFALTAGRFLPGRLLQTSPGEGHHRPGWLEIDLAPSHYPQIAARHVAANQDAVHHLRCGMTTQHGGFNQLTTALAQVSVASDAPILLTGPAGAGKRELATRIAELKRDRGLVTGPLVTVTCGALGTGEQAMETLFGRAAGQGSGTTGQRAGLLRSAAGGVVFIDDVDELPSAAQAMLLRTLDTGSYLPVGANEPVASHFHLICGTSQDLDARVKARQFRHELLARIDIWRYSLPSLKARVEDIPLYVDATLARRAERRGQRVVMEKRARETFLAFAMAPTTAWSSGFRDLSAAVERMATLAPSGRITADLVSEEIDRLKARWGEHVPDTEPDWVDKLMGERAAELDRFDRVQLADVLIVCRASKSLSAAGRTLFAASRARRTSKNDSDRLRKYLARFGLSWADVAK